MKLQNSAFWWQSLVTTPFAFQIMTVAKQRPLNWYILFKRVTKLCFYLVQLFVNLQYKISLTKNIAFVWNFSSKGSLALLSYQLIFCCLHHDTAPLPFSLQGEGLERWQQQWLGWLLQWPVIRQQRFIQFLWRQWLWKLLFILLVLYYFHLVLRQLRLGEQQWVRSRTSKEEEEEEEEMSLWLSTLSVYTSPVCSLCFFCERVDVSVGCLS